MKPATEIQSTRETLLELIDARNLAQAQFERAQLRMDEFLAAAQILVNDANQVPADLKSFPAGVLVWLIKLKERQRELPARPECVRVDLEKFHTCAVCGVVISDNAIYCTAHQQRGNKRPPVPIVQRAD